MKIKNTFCLFALIITIVAFFISGCKVSEKPASPPEDYKEDYKLEEKEKMELEEEPVPQGPFSPYTGTSVDEIFPVPFCVLIENHPKSRPQKGLADAELVYEVPVEGGYTRFLAVYASPYEGEIGPVRSSRPYFAYLIKEHNGIMAHCGYSIHTEEVLREIQLKYIDERFNPLYYRREKSRKKPHNLYTSLEKLFQGAEDKNFLQSKKEPSEPFFSFDVELQKQEKEQTASEIEIKFSPTNYVEYRKNFQGDYIRYNNGELFLDEETEKGIVVENIIVQFVDIRTFTSEGHLNIKLIGEGTGFLFSGGTVEEINWKKESVQSKTVFSGEKGELLLSPGKTWIHLVPQNGKVNWSS